MALELSTAGATVQYSVETTAETRPTAGYSIIPNIKSTPDLNPEPSSLQVTDLSETEYHRYIPGLKDVGGSLSFNANNTEKFQEDWASLVEKFQTAKAAGLGMWFAIVIPGLTKAFYFLGEPSPLGLSAMEVDAALEIAAYIAPVQVAGWQTKPTT